MKKIFKYISWLWKKYRDRRALSRLHKISEIDKVGYAAEFSSYIRATMPKLGAEHLAQRKISTRTNSIGELQEYLNYILTVVTNNAHEENARLYIREPAPWDDRITASPTLRYWMADVRGYYVDPEVSIGELSNTLKRIRGFIALAPEDSDMAYHYHTKTKAIYAEVIIVLSQLK